MPMHTRATHRGGSEDAIFDAFEYDNGGSDRRGGLDGEEEEEEEEEGEEEGLVKGEKSQRGQRI